MKKFLGPFGLLVAAVVVAACGSSSQTVPVSNSTAPGSLALDPPFRIASADAATFAAQVGATASGKQLLQLTGVPTCGGSCCSRSCAPYKTGVLVCQPPSGCRPTGEVCRGDADCCGFGGVQGQTGVGNCSKANPTDVVGRCDNGNACRPAGAICKLATMTCNAENDCCSGNVNKVPLACQQDILGIPRCTIPQVIETPCSTHSRAVAATL